MINGRQRSGLAAVLGYITSSLKLQPNKITDDEDKNKSSIEFGQPEPLLIANKKMSIYSSASIAANTMLPACASLLHYYCPCASGRF